MSCSARSSTARSSPSSIDRLAFLNGDLTTPVSPEPRFVRLVVRMSHRLLILAACLLLAVALAGCGTPGAPQLPSLQLARPVDDLTASRKGNKVELDWTLPRKNTDRTVVKNIPQSQICRHDGTALMSGCTIVATVQNPKPEVKNKGEQSPAVRMKYVDTLPSELGEHDPAGFVRYAVEILNSRERSAGLSNQVLVPLAPTIAPPENLNVKVEADGVLISWKGSTVPVAPSGLTYRYRVMRSPAGSSAYIAVGDIKPEARRFLPRQDIRLGDEVRLPHHLGHAGALPGPQHGG